jgi:lipopolysaccharide assembly protein A
MQVIRTIVWVVLIIALLLFSLNNWEPVQIKIWDELVLETKLPALVVVSFLLGLLPMWLLSKAGKWRLTRRINALENTVKANAVPAPAPPIATSSQLQAASTSDGPIA